MQCAALCRFMNNGTIERPVRLCGEAARKAAIFRGWRSGNTGRKDKRPPAATCSLPSTARMEQVQSLKLQSISCSYRVELYRTVCHREYESHQDKSASRCGISQGAFCMNPNEPEPTAKWRFPAELHQEKQS